MDCNDDMSDPEATVGERVFVVRKALGPNSRRPMAQDAFARLLTERGVRTYYGPEISLWEQGKKDLTRDDIAVVAAVDPLKRGRDWLGWGDEKAPAGAGAEKVQPGPTKPSPAETAAFLTAEMEAARQEREQVEAARTGEGRKRPRRAR